MLFHALASRRVVKSQAYLGLPLSFSKVYATAFNEARRNAVRPQSGIQVGSIAYVFYVAERSVASSSNINGRDASRARTLGTGGHQSQAQKATPEKLSSPCPPKGDTASVPIPLLGKVLMATSAVLFLGGTGSLLYLLLDNPEPVEVAWNIVR